MQTYYNLTEFAAQIAIARVLYQKKDYEGSIEAYARIPRDHYMWHDAMFEKSWAMLRATRFRSVLSNLQSLHSSYYDDFYIPETLLLRSIVYLYICKYDEIDKVLNLFDKQYVPVLNSITNFLKSKSNMMDYYSEVEKAYILKKDEESTKKTVLPLKVANKVYQEGNVRRSINYIKKLVEERKVIDENPNIKNSSIGQYSIKILANRIKGAKSQTGEFVKAHLANLEIELKDLKLFI